MLVACVGVFTAKVIHYKCKLKTIKLINCFSIKYCCIQLKRGNYVEFNRLALILIVILTRTLSPTLQGDFKRVSVVSNSMGHFPRFSFFQCGFIRKATVTN